MSTLPLKSSSFPEPSKSEANWMIVIGILLGFLGISAMTSPLIVGISVFKLVGILLVAGGLGQVIFALQSESRSNRTFYFVLSAISVVCGLLMINQSLFAIKFMTALLVAYFLLSGASEIIHAIQFRTAHGWGWMLASGAISLLLALLIWNNWPLSGAWAIGVFVGLKLIVCGAALTAIGLAARSILGNKAI